MLDTKNANLKKPKNSTNANNDPHKENKFLNLKDEQKNIKILQKKLNVQYDKNAKPLFIGNQNHNHIESINILNNNKNYKNIILNNMLTPNKKLLINEKLSTKNIKKINERNILFDNGNVNGNKNFKTLGQNKQKSLNKNSALKLFLNNQEQENPNDIEMKYKLILFEKNNLINKLKNEVEYYKNYYHNINMNMNIILPNNNSNTIEANRNTGISLAVNDKKNIGIDGENIRNRIKNIFSLPKKEIKFDNNHLLQHNINEYNTIKTFVKKINNDTINNNNNVNYNNSETTKEYASQIKNNFNTIENNSSSNNNKMNNNKLLLSNDSLKNDIVLHKNSNENNIGNTKTLNNVFYRSNSNTIQKKGRKLKLGLQPSELTLDINNNNFNSIEANRNYNNTIKNKKHIIYSLNMLNSKTGSDNDIDTNNNSNKLTIDDNSINRFGKNKIYFNNISNSPSSLYKDIANKNTIDDNSGSLIAKNDNNEKFDYKENYEKLKQKMNNLVNNLFELIEIQNKKQEIKNNENDK